LEIPYLIKKLLLLIIPKYTNLLVVS